MQSVFPELKMSPLNSVELSTVNGGQDDPNKGWGIVNPGEWADAFLDVVDGLYQITYSAFYDLFDNCDC